MILSRLTLMGAALVALMAVGCSPAAEETTDRRILVIGSNANQNDLKPEIIPASAVIDVAKTFVSIATSVKDGTFKGGIFQEDLRSGNIYLAVSDAFKDRIPGDVWERIRKAEEEIRAGTLKPA